MKQETSIFERIEKLKKERNAIILAHFYQADEIQDIADVMGDSLALAQAAQKTDADVILFCGVHFMAETAKILNPEKIVIMPDREAGCSLADSAPAKEFSAWIAKYPDHKVVSYINCSTEVKAMSDLICTSSNAEKMLASFADDQALIFAPDQYLGGWLKKITGRNLRLWNGSCIVHEQFSQRELLRLKSKHPDAKVLAHPECTEAILQHADVIGSTSKIIAYATKSEFHKFIIATEPGVLHQMRQVAPNREYIELPGMDESCACNTCPHMRLNTLEKMEAALQNLEPRIELDEDLRLRALKPLQRMLDLSETL